MGRIVMGRPCSGDIHVRVGGHFYHGGALLSFEEMFSAENPFWFLQGLGRFLRRPSALFLRGARQIWRPVSVLSVRRYLGACSVWLSVGVGPTDRRRSRKRKGKIWIGVGVVLSTPR